MMGRLGKLYQEFMRRTDPRHTAVHMMGHGKKMDTFTREVMVCVNLMTFYHILAHRDEIEIVYTHTQKCTPSTAFVVLALFLITNVCATPCATPKCYV